ncbi:hypothetical protein Q0V21_11585 [Paenibacillus sp. 11B]|nr:hypothetical protein [Paenibacillus sp. 11B]
MLLRSMGATAKATVIRANAVEVTRSILKKRQRSPLSPNFNLL